MSIPTPPEGFEFAAAPTPVYDAWLEQLDRLGPDLVRLKMANTRPIPHMHVNFVDTRFEGNKYQAFVWFVQAWLVEKDAQTARRARWQHGMLWVTVVSAVVGAFASVATLVLNSP